MALLTISLRFKFAIFAEPLEGTLSSVSFVVFSFVEFACFVIFAILATVTEHFGVADKLLAIFSVFAAWQIFAYAFNTEHISHNLHNNPNFQDYMIIT